jgi:hypothetical protein
MSNPIRPQDIVKQKVKLIPKEVIDAFNEMIAKNFTGTSSWFKQKDVVELIKEKGIFVVNEKGKEDFLNPWNFLYNSFEIIGNIFENPELI